jgi:hypothetical protein
VQSDDELEAWVIKNVDTGYHPVGTCRMSTDRNDGVVDGPPASAPLPRSPLSSTASVFGPFNETVRTVSKRLSEHDLHDT